MVFLPYYVITCVTWGIFFDEISISLDLHNNPAMQQTIAPPPPHNTHTFLVGQFLKKDFGLPGANCFLSKRPLGKVLRPGKKQAAQKLSAFVKIAGWRKL